MTRSKQRKRKGRDADADVIPSVRLQPPCRQSPHYGLVLQLLASMRCGRTAASSMSDLCTGPHGAPPEAVHSAAFTCVFLLPGPPPSCASHQEQAVSFVEGALASPEQFLPYLTATLLALGLAAQPAERREEGLGDGSTRPPLAGFAAETRRRATACFATLRTAFDKAAGSEQHAGGDAATALPALLSLLPAGGEPSRHQEHTTPTASASATLLPLLRLCGTIAAHCTEGHLEGTIPLPEAGVAHPADPTTSTPRSYKALVLHILHRGVRAAAEALASERSAAAAATLEACVEACPPLPEVGAAVRSAVLQHLFFCGSDPLPGGVGGEVLRCRRLLEKLFALELRGRAHAGTHTEAEGTRSALIGFCLTLLGSMRSAALGCPLGGGTPPALCAAASLLIDLLGAARGSHALLQGCLPHTSPTLLPAQAGGTDSQLAALLHGLPPQAAGGEGGHRAEVMRLAECIGAFQRDCGGVLGFSQEGSDGGADQGVHFMGAVQLLNSATAEALQRDPAVQCQALACFLREESVVVSALIRALVRSGGPSDLDTSHLQFIPCAAELLALSAPLLSDASFSAISLQVVAFRIDHSLVGPLYRAAFSRGGCAATATAATPAGVVAPADVVTPGSFTRHVMRRLLRYFLDEEVEVEGRCAMVPFVGGEVAGALQALAMSVWGCVSQDVVPAAPADAAAAVVPSGDHRDVLCSLGFLLSCIWGNRWWLGGGLDCAGLQHLRREVSLASRALGIAAGGAAAAAADTAGLQGWEAGTPTTPSRKARRLGGSPVAHPAEPGSHALVWPVQYTALEWAQQFSLEYMVHFEQDAPDPLCRLSTSDEGSGSGDAVGPSRRDQRKRRRRRRKRGRPVPPRYARAPGGAEVGVLQKGTAPSPLALAVDLLRSAADQAGPSVAEPCAEEAEEAASLAEQWFLWGVRDRSAAVAGHFSALFPFSRDCEGAVAYKHMLLCQAFTFVSAFYAAGTLEALLRSVVAPVLEGWSLGEGLHTLPRFLCRCVLLSCVGPSAFPHSSLAELSVFACVGGGQREDKAKLRLCAMAAPLLLPEEIVHKLATLVVSVGAVASQPQEALLSCCEEMAGMLIAQPRTELAQLMQLYVTHVVKGEAGKGTGLRCDLLCCLQHTVEELQVQQQEEEAAGGCPGPVEEVLLALAQLEGQLRDEGGDVAMEELAEGPAGSVGAAGGEEGCVPEE